MAHRPRVNYNLGVKRGVCMKLTKLAFMNVKKSYKDYFVYFLTLMFSVCLFYTFNSFSAQESIMELSESASLSMQTVGLFMNVLSVFVAIVLAFLILYANNFLIRRRKKEFGIYMLLGMPKKDISKILVCETLFVGMTSLVVGIVLGVLCSQILGVITANMFHANVNYHIIFSAVSAIATVVCFSVIFFTIMLLNTRVIAKVKLIDMLHAKKKVEKVKITKPWAAVLVLLVSLICLGVAYYLTSSSMTTFAVMLVPIIVIGSVGTLLFFVSLSGFLLQFIRFNKGVYYKKLNMFVLRQINAKINTTSLSMGVVCLMLLLSIGALSCGISLNHTLVDSVKQSTPYDYTYTQDEDIDEATMKQLFALDEVDDWNRVDFYSDGETLNILLPYLSSDHARESFYADATMMYISLSDYNEAMRSQHKKEVTLQKGEAFFISGNESILDYANEVAAQHIEYPALNQKVQLCVKSEEISVLSTNYMPDIMLALVVPDDMTKAFKPYGSDWNINIAQGVKLSDYNAQVEENFEQYVSNHDIKNYRYSGLTKTAVEENSLGMGMLFVYIGLYLGIVFMVSSAAILALQQLSEAEDNKTNYEVLRKIGTPSKMINRSILLQIGIYFVLPLLLAIIHSFVGVPAVSGAFSYMFGIGSMWKSNLITGGIILVIYGSYFYVTYQGYKATMQK